MHRNLIIISLLVVLPIRLGHAQALSEDECTRLHPEITTAVQMSECTSGVEGSEIALAEALSALSLRVPDTERPKLSKSQQTWLAYRDATCAWEAAGFNGSMGTSLFSDCLAGMNRERVEYLQKDLARWN